MNQALLLAALVVLSLEGDAFAKTCLSHFAKAAREHNLDGGPATHVIKERDISQAHSVSFDPDVVRPYVLGDFPYMKGPLSRCDLVPAQGESAPYQFNESDFPNQAAIGKSWAEALAKQPVFPALTPPPTKPYLYDPKSFGGYRPVRAGQTAAPAAKLVTAESPEEYSVQPPKDRVLEFGNVGARPPKAPDAPPLPKREPASEVVTAGGALN